MCDVLTHLHFNLPNGLYCKSNKKTEYIMVYLKFIPNFPELCNTVLTATQYRIQNLQLKILRRTGRNNLKKNSAHKNPYFTAKPPAAPSRGCAFQGVYITLCHPFRTSTARIYRDMAHTSRDTQNRRFWPPNAHFRAQKTLPSHSIRIVQYVCQVSHSIYTPFRLNLFNIASLYQGTSNPIPNFCDHLRLTIRHHFYACTSTTFLSHQSVRIPKSLVPAEHTLKPQQPLPNVRSAVPPACATRNGKRFVLMGTLRWCLHCPIAM